MSELDPGKRWEQGVPHDSRSKELIRALSELDWEFLNGHFDIKVGGDGDNGESLMYLLDIYFERKDKALVAETVQALP